MRRHAEALEAAAEPDVRVGKELPGPDSRLCMVQAGFSFDSYTEIDRAQGVWVCDADNDRPGLEGVRLSILSPRFVRDAFSGILRVRVISLSGIRGVPVAGAVGVSCRAESGSPGGLCGFRRNTTRRGVLNGRAGWQDEDDSVYVYIPRGGGDGGGAAQGGDRPTLHIEVQKANIITGSHFGLLAYTSLPSECWGSGELRELKIELEMPEELRPVRATEGEGAEGSDEASTEVAPPTVQLQLQFDEFHEPLEQLGSGCEEVIDDVTPEARLRRKRFGSHVPSEILNPDTERMDEGRLIAALRRRGLPHFDVSGEELRERLDTSLAAEKALRDADAMWSTVEGVMGTSGKEQLQGALGAASSVAETLSGNVFGALGAGLMTGASEVPGVKEIMSGDFAGAMGQRQRIWDAATTGKGRGALNRKISLAAQRAQKQAMLRLAGGMELMSVRRGAWKMLEQAVLDEGSGAESFSEYELLAYMEAGSTNTECWVWRLRSRRRLLVAFRGTCDFGDVLTDITAVPRDMGDLGKIHDGFSRAYASVRVALQAVLCRGCGGDASGWELLFTGHSLGGALATLASLDVARAKDGVADDFWASGQKGWEPEKRLAESPLKDAEVNACTFGAPRVGSARFCALYNRWVPKAWRVFSSSDIIPTVPPTTLFGFQHSGIGVELDPAKNELIVRGRVPGLQKAAAKELAEAAAQEVENLIKGSDDDSAVTRARADIWSSWDDKELEELRRVLSTGTQAVGEHMEDNYFARIQEVLSADLDKRAANDEIEF